VKRDPLPGQQVVFEPIEQVDLPALVYRAVRKKIFAASWFRAANLTWTCWRRAARKPHADQRALARLAEEGW